MRRAALAVATGSLASLALAVALGEIGGPGLRATVVTAPLALGLLAGLGRRLGARPASGGERLLAAGWFALAAAVDSLGLAGLEVAVFVAGASIFVRRAAALLPALRRRLGRVGARASWALAALAFVVGLAILPWLEARGEPLGDEPYYLLLAESWWSDGDVDLADEYRDDVARGFLGRELGPQQGDPVGPHGELYSRHGPFLPLVLSPFWAAGGVLGVRLAMLALWALLAGSMLRLALAFGLPQRAALRAAIVAAAAPPLVLYAQAIWIEVPAALAISIALERWLAARSPAAGARRGGWGVALAALPLLKLRLLAVAVPLGALAFAGRARRTARGAVVLGAVAAAGAAVMLRNWWLEGSALGVYELRDLALERVSLAQSGVAAWGLAFDAAFGLVAWAPIWLLAVPGLARAAWRRPAFAAALAAFVPYLALVVSRREWFGGWSPPFRYGVILVPVLAIGLGELWRRPPTRAQRRLAAALGALTALATLTAWIEPGWVVSFADGRSRLVDLATAPFAADFARFLPSAVRPRLATWAVPLVALAVVALAARGRRRPVGSAAAVGVTALLLGGAALVEAAHRVPTRVVHAEDPWLAHRGGALFPSRWTFDRTRFVGGWTMAAGHRIALMPVAGGEVVVVRARVRTLQPDAAPALFVLRTGDAWRRSWRVEPGTGWQWLESEPLAWRRGEPLEVLARALEGRRSAIVLDRLELEWR